MYVNALFLDFVTKWWGTRQDFIFRFSILHRDLCSPFGVVGMEGTKKFPVEIGARTRIGYEFRNWGQRKWCTLAPPASLLNLMETKT